MKVSYIDHMGSDESVVNAARISMDKDASLYTDAQNESLINYLASGMRASEKRDLIYAMSQNQQDTKSAELFHQIKNIATHWTPFAHTCITLRCSAPVPIRTQSFKHKQGLVENEESRRYISSRPELYIPPHFRAAAKDVKQGSAGIHPHSDYYIQQYTELCENAIDEYMMMIERGVCPEQARFILPQGVLVNWIWTGNLFAFANFYLKRSDPHAQEEIRVLAEQVKNIIQPLFPVSWAALCGQ